VSPTRTTFGARRERAGGALAASLLVHAAVILIVYTLATQAPRPNPNVSAARRTDHKELIWIVAEGPGGGGGGGGNRTPEPPARLQTRGPDALSVPVLRRPPVTPPPTSPPPRPTPPPDPPVVALDVPVRPMSAGEMASLGAVDGLPIAPPGSRGPGTTGAGPGPDGGGSGPGLGLGLGPGNGPDGVGPAYGVGNGVTAPQLIREVKPAYTTEAMRARIQGEVELSAIVRPDGSVTDLRVLRSLDGLFGLDEEAIKAARQWRFRPGTRFGQPVSVYVKIAVGFTMR
jgi:periplasmic protein TonB